MDRHRVLVCGSGYGAAYILALARLGHPFCCCGLLARGSERSQRLAATRDIPLYRSVWEIPRETDLACVVVGGKAGSVLARELLECGIPVLLEHPVRAEDLEASLEVAAASGTHLHVNAHLHQLEASRSWLDEVQSICQAGKQPHAMLASTDVRTLFSALDLIGHAFGGFAERPVFESAERGTEKGSLVQVRVRVGALPILLQHAHLQGERDDGTDAIWPLSCTAVFPEERVHLISPIGPVVRAHVPARRIGVSQELLWERRDGTRSATLSSYVNDRSSANLLAIKELADRERGKGCPPGQTSAHLLAVADLWEELMNRLGPPAYWSSHATSGQAGTD